MAGTRGVLLQLRYLLVAPYESKRTPRGPDGERERTHYMTTLAIGQVMGSSSATGASARITPPWKCWRASGEACRRDNGPVLIVNITKLLQCQVVTPICVMYVVN